MLWGTPGKMELFFPDQPDAPSGTHLQVNP
jgi:hypothetical protein